MAREFRGVWVASVANIDWPSRRGLSTAEAQAELLALLDRAAALRLNAVIFQVRPSADALYRSSIEPWSEYLTGRQGRAPQPAWDPLAFAVREAHARNLELHAWFNPYRARHTDARSPLSARHIARTSPALVKAYGGYLWMDPGEPAVRRRTMRVVLDVVTRYDIDGVHIDDYFYPYPVNGRNGRPLPFPDDRSWRRYRRDGGTLDRDDWRRRNVDQLVRALNDSIHARKPWVRFGVSPFGIWRPGNPPQVKGFDAYAQLYADARRWWREGWVDYLAPQLYWPTTKAEQAYPVLLDWWAAENVRGRHLWPGNFTSRAGGTGSGAFSVDELLAQLRVTRASPGAGGNIHFSMKAFLGNQGGMNDTLLAGPYATPALPPATPWLRVPPPAVPRARLAPTGDGWCVAFTTPAARAPRQWVVRTRTAGGWGTEVLPGTVRSVTLPPDAASPVVVVSALNRAGVEGKPLILRPDSAAFLSRPRSASFPACAANARPSSIGSPRGSGSP
ncbi:MAG: family 10 glycosylhydrolase [Gemmatimonadetes bacterium]|nr:family 10 glycosylhydrolase [Gemmatimonadota bacterium]